MIEIFKHIDGFLQALSKYLTYNYIFITFVGLFLLAAICIFITTARSYESRLIKSIDMFNSYFLNNPQITEENLVSFNEKMKSKKVPKQLRKQWQQYVLYREAKASYYMSFENCVSNPIKNSTYKRDVKLLHTFTWIMVVLSLVLNCFYAFQLGEIDLASFFKNIVLCPAVILFLNLLATIFLDLRHNAIVSDLFQNYQYFEVNIDKATETLPDYVDYEVLFDKNEIKKGIPILYAYLQKRAEEEQRELERARLKNVEHEKFNFDDQGVAASLVLERAMQEAENYIAERKKYNQDIQQINNDITQEEMNYREITKEYNRQMQVSKETFDNFKAQLEEVSSTIEANYLKKQQQQELDRQRNLERDFDTATERHKKILEQYQEELDTVDKFIAESRKTLEEAMKSEFKSYSIKVYDEVEKLVDEREKEKYSQLKSEIRNLEEKLISKGDELNTAYAENQELNEKLTVLNESVNAAPVYQEPTPIYEEAPAVQEVADDYQTEEVSNYVEPIGEEVANNVYNQYNDVQEINNSTVQTDDSIDVKPAVSRRGRPKKSVDTLGATPAKKPGRPRKEPTEVVSTEPKKGRGRPRKEVVTTENVEQEKKTRGRPRKIVTEVVGTEPKKGRGRPRKEPTEVVSTEPKKGRGRPRKEVVATENVEQEKKTRGRPRKIVTEVVGTEPKKGRGRPRKEVVATENVKQEKKTRGRPRKVVTEVVETEPKKGRGRPRKEVVATENVEQEKKTRGRPRKEDMPSDINDIDAYLKQIDDAIAKENARIEETQKELAKKAKLKAKK